MTLEKRGDGNTAGRIILGIILALFLIVFVLLHISIKAYVEFDKKRLRLKVRYLCFKLYELDTDKTNVSALHNDKNKPSSGKPEIEISELEETFSTQTDLEKDSETEKSEKSTLTGGAQEANVENDSDGNDDKKQKGSKSLKERWEEIKPFFPIAKNGMKKLLKMIRLYDLELHLAVGGDDAYKAGMNFARANQVFYPALALICTAFSVKIKKTEINCDYSTNTFDASGAVVVKVCPSAVVALAVYLGINYLKIKHKNKKKQKFENERKKDKADD